MDTRLLDILVCPLCKGKLQYDRLGPGAPEGGCGSQQPGAAPELICQADRLAFPVRDGIPVMLESEARQIDTGVDSGAAPL